MQKDFSLILDKMTKFRFQILVPQTNDMEDSVPISVLLKHKPLENLEKQRCGHENSIPLYFSYAIIFVLSFSRYHYF